MWDRIQQPEFLVGACFVLICQAGKFSQLNVCDPATNRYVALLPGAQVRDFTGRYQYLGALTLFLGFNLGAYLLLCQIPASVYGGVIKVFSTGPADLPLHLPLPEYLPLWVAALLVGATQPIPHLSRIGDAQRNFFHDRIEVPRRVIELAERLKSAIESRSGSGKRQLALELEKLASREFTSNLAAFGDVIFYKTELQNLGIANDIEIKKIIRTSSIRELQTLIERLVLYALIAVMRRSGPKSLSKVAHTIGIPPSAILPRKTGGFFGGFLASGLLFSFGLLIIAHIVNFLRKPVLGILGGAPDYSSWPKDLANVGEELLMIVPPMAVCTIIAVWALVPSREASSQRFSPSSGSAFSDLVNFFKSSSSILVMCVLVSILYKLGQLFFEYGGLHVPPEARSPTRLILPLIQSFIPITVCLFTTWYLANRNEPARPPVSLARTLLIMSGTIMLIAYLYDLTFLQEYLKGNNEKLAPAWEHVIFTVLINVLVSLCAFGSVALFFRARASLSESSEAHETRGSTAKNYREPPHTTPPNGRGPVQRNGHTPALATSPASDSATYFKQVDFVSRTASAPHVPGKYVLGGSEYSRPLASSGSASPRNKSSTPRLGTNNM